MGRVVRVMIIIALLILSVCACSIHIALAEMDEQMAVSEEQKVQPDTVDDPEASDEKTEPQYILNDENITGGVSELGILDDEEARHDEASHSDAVSAELEEETRGEEAQSAEGERSPEIQSITEQSPWVRPMQAKLILGINTSASIPFITSEDTSSSLTYRSENNAIAKVDAQGKVTAYADGETRIVATNAAGVSGALEVTVLPAPTQIIPCDSELSLHVGEMHGVYFDTIPEQSYSEYSYSSSNSAVAKVGTNGQVSGMAAGKATITVRAAIGGASASLAVEVLPVPEDRKLLTMAHRGASGYHPENTLEAFIHAPDYGSDNIELDVRRTKDGKIICHHDASIKINGVKRNITDLTLAQIRACNPSVPEFVEAMETIRDETNMTVMVEIKQTGIEESVMQIVNASGMKDRVAYGSFSQSSVNKIRSLSDETLIVFILSSSDVLSSIFSSPAKYVYDVFSLEMKLVTEKVVRDLHLMGKKVLGWTANDEASVSRLRKMGVDGITTNYPDLIG